MPYNALMAGKGGYLLAGQCMPQACCLILIKGGAISDGDETRPVGGERRALYGANMSLMNGDLLPSPSIPEPWDPVSRGDGHYSSPSGRR